MTEFGVFNNDGKNAKWQIKRQTKKTWQKALLRYCGQTGQSGEQYIFTQALCTSLE